MKVETFTIVNGLLLVALVVVAILVGKTLSQFFQNDQQLQKSRSLEASCLTLYSGGKVVRQWETEVRSFRQISTPGRQS